MKFPLLAILPAICFATANFAGAQTIATPYDAYYTLADLGTPTGISGNLGGLTFLDADTLLIGGAANTASGAIYSIDVIRDPGTQSITGFAGPAAFYATAPNIDGGLAFGPGGVLFYTAFPTHELGQIKPGSAAPDKVIDLSSTSLGSSVGTLAFVPGGMPGAGQLKIASYSSGVWMTAALSSDGTGTYDVVLSNGVGVGDGPEGILFLENGNPGFATHSVLITKFATGIIDAYELDANGDPILSTRTNFMYDVPGALGAVRDPVTGDFVFNTFTGGNKVLVVSGFNVAVVPEPGVSALLMLSGVVSLMRRRRN